MLRSVIERFPVTAADAPSTRDHAGLAELEAIIQRLDGLAIERGATPLITSDIVARALADAEASIATSGDADTRDTEHAHSTADCPRQPPRHIGM